MFPVLCFFFLSFHGNIIHLNGIGPKYSLCSEADEAQAFLIKTTTAAPLNYMVFWFSVLHLCQELKLFKTFAGLSPEATTVCLKPRVLKHNVFLFLGVTKSKIELLVRHWDSENKSKENKMMMLFSFKFNLLVFISLGALATSAEQDGFSYFKHHGNKSILSQ